ncbi:MAG: transposase, partial [Muribaculaceae bacterium]|nr:transposase [Muribaculaceae bacterium]
LKQFLKPLGQEHPECICGFHSANLTLSQKFMHRILCLSHNSRLAVIVGTMKAAVTRYARTRCIASLPIWQSRFYEHIIRDQHSFDYIMNYVDENVLRWDSDCFNQSTK